MKRISYGALIMLTAALTVVPAIHAQKIATAAIPFDFRVDSTWLPGGTYEVRDMNQSAILIVTTDNKQHALVLNMNAGDNKAGATKLIFDKVGNNYFLREIWTSVRDQGVRVHESRAEKEMLASSHNSSGQGAETVIVAMR
jgi:hypothetical protein